eukprot:6460155-Amphidinium_carterae.1
MGRPTSPPLYFSSVDSYPSPGPNLPLLQLKPNLCLGLPGPRKNIEYPQNRTKRRSLSPPVMHK